MEEFKFTLLGSVEVSSVQLAWSSSAWVSLAQLSSVHFGSVLLGVWGEGTCKRSWMERGGRLVKRVEPCQPMYLQSPRTPPTHTHSAGLDYPLFSSEDRWCCQEEGGFAGVRGVWADGQTSTSGREQREPRLATPPWQLVLRFRHVINDAVFCLDFLGLEYGKHENKPLNVAFKVTSGPAFRTATVEVGRVTEQGSNWWKKEFNPQISLFNYMLNVCFKVLKLVELTHLMFVSWKMFPLDTTRVHQLCHCWTQSSSAPSLFSLVLLYWRHFHLKSRKKSCQVWFSSQHPSLK